MALANGSNDNNPIFRFEKHLPLFMASLTIIVSVAAAYRGIMSNLEVLDARLDIIQELVLKDLKHDTGGGK